GPLGGLGEIELPALQPGSSIMPGKINPVVPEAMVMVCAQVIGHHTAITVAGQTGNFQLNVALPLIAANLLDSIGLLANASRLLADSSIAGIRLRRDNIGAALDRNPILVTALNPVIGYEKAAAIAKRAYREGRPVFEIALEDSGLAADELRRLLDPAALTRGGIPGRTDGCSPRRMTGRVRSRPDGPAVHPHAMTAGPAPGVGPVDAVAMGVVAHAWARIYGTLGVGWLATLQVADIEDIVAAAFRSSLLILIPTCPGGLLVVWLYGRWAGPLARPHPRRRHRVRRPHFIGGDDEPQQRTPHRTPVHPRAARHGVDPALPGQRGRCGHPAARRQRGR